MNYKDYRKAYRTWLIGLILFSVAGIWYIYRVITDKSLSSIIFLLVFVALIIFNYSRIKMIRDKVKDAKQEYKTEIVDNL